MNGKNKHVILFLGLIFVYKNIAINYIEMFMFSQPEKKPIYIMDKIDKNLIVDHEDKCKIIIDSKLRWAENDAQKIQTIINSYIPSPKIVYIFLIGDIDTTFEIPLNVRFYRTSLYKSRQVKNEFVLPYLWEGATCVFDPLQKIEKPIVGFCGEYSFYRRKTINLLNENNKIQTNFILRDRFMCGITHDDFFAVKNNETNELDVVQSFFNNVKHSHFTLCNRGVGNFTIRFYQVLSCGRIPILLNTDLVLPFSDEIDWKEIIVIANTEEELIQRLLDYWEHKDIILMQKKCREIYETYFMGTSFFDRILDSGN
jgi:hypothetical protein